MKNTYIICDSFEQVKLLTGATSGKGTNKYWLVKDGCIDSAFKAQGSLGDHLNTLRNKGIAKVDPKNISSFSEVCQSLMTRPPKKEVLLESTDHILNDQMVLPSGDVCNYVGQLTDGRFITCDKRITALGSEETITGVMTLSKNISKYYPLDDIVTTFKSKMSGRSIDTKSLSTNTKVTIIKLLFDVDIKK